MNSLLSYEKVEPQTKIINIESKLKSSKNSNEPLQNSPSALSESTVPNNLTMRSIGSSERSNTNKIAEETSSQSKLNQKKKMFDELIAREGSVEKLLHVKNNSKTVYDVDGMSTTQIRQSLTRVDDNTAKPFSFLADIVKDPEKEKPKLTRVARDQDQELNSTDIDVSVGSMYNLTFCGRGPQPLSLLALVSGRHV